jgi:hypothetical protein
MAFIGNYIWVQKPKSTPNFGISHSKGTPHTDSTKKGNIFKFGGKFHPRTLLTTFFYLYWGPGTKIKTHSFEI